MFDTRDISASLTKRNASVPVVGVPYAALAIAMAASAVVLVALITG
jgi:hypothetical protein